MVITLSHEQVEALEALTERRVVMSRIPSLQRMGIVVFKQDWELTQKGQRLVEAIKNGKFKADAEGMEISL